MIVFVDNEHEKGFLKPWGQKMMVARLRIKYRLEDISGQPCLVVRYNHITPELLQQLNIQAILVSGNSTDITEYDEADLIGLRTIFREKKWPTFGFCGGFQLIAETDGAELARIGPLPPGQTDDPKAEIIFSPGMIQEFGYMSVQVAGEHPLLDGLGSSPIFRQAHYWEIKSLPDGFINYGQSKVTPLQLIVHKELPIAGTQFHPEYYTDEHPAGKQLIENFFKWAGVIR